MADDLNLPSLLEVPDWSITRCRHERTRCQTELAFIVGDRGGPDRTERAAHLRALLHAIDLRLSA